MGRGCQLGRAPSDQNWHSIGSTVTNDSLLLHNIRDERTVHTSTAIQMNRYNTIHRRMRRTLLTEEFEAIYRNCFSFGRRQSLSFLPWVGLVW